jgi:hypothetical protein
MLKKFLLTLVIFHLLIAFATKAQNIDSIYFNLYTDSLKKGVYNYINIDAKLSNGRWLPLTVKEVKLITTGGLFDGNNLWIDTTFREEKVTVTATLKKDTTISQSITIYIKKREEAALLKTFDQLQREIEEQVPVRRNKKKKGMKSK